jgi:hypothetical protein
MPKPPADSSSSGFFPPWRARLAPLGRRSAALVHAVRQYTLAQIEWHLAAALPASLLGQNAAQAYSRERIFTLARTVWCWLWQVLQAHTSCREVVRQVQALFALHDAGAVDESTGAAGTSLKVVGFDRFERGLFGGSPRGDLLLNLPHLFFFRWAGGGVRPWRRGGAAERGGGG